MTEAGPEGPNEPPRKSRRGFSFSFNLGNSGSAGEDAELQRLLEEARSKSEASGGSASVQEGQTQVEFKDGVLSFVRDDQPQFSHDFATGRSNTHLPDPFPVLNTIRRWFNLVVTALAFAVPVGLISLAIATGQSLETTFYIGLFGLIVCGMLLSSLRVRRSPLEELLPLVLEERARAARGEQSSSADPPPPLSPL